MNLRPSGYEPDELPNCSTPRYLPLFECLVIIAYLILYCKGILKKIYGAYNFRQIECCASLFDTV